LVIDFGNQSVNQSINQSVNQSINQSVKFTPLTVSKGKE